MDTAKDTLRTFLIPHKIVEAELSCGCRFDEGDWFCCSKHPKRSLFGYKEQDDALVPDFEQKLFPTLFVAEQT